MLVVVFQSVAVYILKEVRMDIINAFKRQVVTEQYVQTVTSAVRTDFSYQGLTAIFLNNRWIANLDEFPKLCRHWFNSYNQIILHAGLTKTMIHGVGLRVFEVAAKDPVLVGVALGVWALVALRITYVLSSAFSSIGMAVGTGALVSYLCLRPSEGFHL
jgi:hypothetical protein